ncbi:hypothetical protein GQX74_008501 [Glossina fuscipes]|nr:hypothetical protein GQX74_008501 [Glossina fuscipes]
MVSKQVPELCSPQAYPSALVYCLIIVVFPIKSVAIMKLLVRDKRSLHISKHSIDNNRDE